MISFVRFPRPIEEASSLKKRYFFRVVCGIVSDTWQFLDWKAVCECVCDCVCIYICVCVCICTCICSVVSNSL